MHNIKSLCRKLLQILLLTYNVIVPTKGMPVLLYHKTTNRNCTPSIPNIDLVTFEEQISYLRKNGYHSVSLKQLEDFLYHNIELPKKPIMITFDDGYEENIDSFKILNNYGFSCVCCIATAYLSEKLNYMPFWFDMGRMDYESSSVKGEDFIFLSEEQIKNVVELGVEFCSHTHHHINMDTQPDEIINDELNESINAIIRMTGKNQIGFSYPVGKHCPENKAQLKKYGIKLAFAVFPGTVTETTNPYLIPRHNVSKERMFFKLCLTDKYPLYDRISHRINGTKK